MLNELAYNQGVAAGMAKFAVMSAFFDRYAHLPTDSKEFREQLEKALAAEGKQRFFNHTSGAGEIHPPDPSRVGPAPLRSVITAAPLEATFIPHPSVKASPIVPGTAAGPRATTNPGQRNPLLSKPPTSR